MPLYTNQPLNPQDQQQQQQQGQNPNAPVMPEGRRARGTGFTNIGKMLGANVGAGSQMGQNIGQGISQKAGKVTKDVSSAYGTFQEGYGKSQGDIFGEGGAFSSVSGLLPGSVGYNAGNLGNLTDEQAIELGKKMREAGYTGPAGLANQDQLIGRIGGIQNLGRLATSGAAGQGMLLAGSAGKRGYSRGQGYLDQFLLAQDPAAQQAIQQAAASGLSAGQQAMGQLTGAASQAASLQEAIKEQRSDIDKKLAEKIGVISDEGKLQAKSFLADADRLKQLLTDTSEKGYITDHSGQKVFDPNQLLKDQELIQNMGKYGINPSVDVYAGDEEGSTSALDEYIKTMAGEGATGYSGQTKYTEDQQKALKKLALITNQSELATSAQTPFTSPFEVASKDISGGTFQKQRQGKIEDLQKETGIKDASQVNKLVNDINKTIGLKDFEGNSGNPHYEFDRAANSILGQDLYNQVSRETMKQVGGDLLTDYKKGVFRTNLVNALKKKLEPLQKLNNIYSSKTNLQDYINKKFGLPSGPNAIEAPSANTQGPRVITQY